MIIQTGAAGSGAGAHDRVVDVAAGTTTLRELIGVLVREELDAYERRRGDADVLRLLTPADLAVGASRGVYGRERRATPKAPTAEDAIARAAEAFGDGLVLVFLDGRQLDELDTPITITEDSVLRMIRLVALSGVRR